MENVERFVEVDIERCYQDEIIIRYSAKTFKEPCRALKAE